MTLPVFDGRGDIECAIAGLAARLPAALAPLARLAFNYRWCWLPGGSALFQEIDPHRWERCHQNPVRLLQEVQPRAIARAEANADLVARAQAMEAGLREELARPSAAGPFSDARPLVFLCAEYGIHRSLPIYAGGLGGLAGDFLKEASDQALPCVAVGLLYRQGYFHQRVDLSGWQHEYWIDTDPERLPMVRVSGPDAEPIRIELSLRGRRLQAQIWRVEVGRTRLFLLDMDLPENARVDRWITSRLYVSDREVRLAQYLLLGVGGLRVLHALGIEPGLLHLNEGHAAFGVLELAREAAAGGLRFEEAFAAARARTVFTTHTPVMAGNESYDAGDASELAGVLDDFRAEVGLKQEELLRLGRVHPDDPHEAFGLTPFAIHVSRSINGVSRRHARVARAMWSPLWPERPVDAVPITHVTNGVHVASWVGPAMHALFERHLGAGWERRLHDPALLAGIERIPDEELWAARVRQRHALVDWARDRSSADRLSRGEPRDYVEAAVHAFDPDILTVGFARRIATYKRLHLISYDAQRALRLLHGSRPLQLLIAGKAHPQDDEAKRTVQPLFALRRAPLVGSRVAYLEDYGLGMAEQLVRGCDLWVNLPRPPLEASGTSGMKSVVNGGLQLSVLDGWWEEGFDGMNGWAIDGDVGSDHAAQDERHAGALYYLLEHDVLPLFYERDAAGLPRAWLARVKASLRSLLGRFSATRMLNEYRERIYAPP